jgi:hypothetical protein
MKKPLSCVERGVSRGSKKQYSQPGSCLKNKLKFGLTDSKKKSKEIMSFHLHLSPAAVPICFANNFIIKLKKE